MASNFPGRRALLLGLIGSFVLIAAAAFAGLGSAPTGDPNPSPVTFPEPLLVEDLAAPHVEPSPSPEPSPPAPPSPAVKAAAKPRPKPNPAAFPSGGLAAYRGLGAWVDLYDYAIRDTMNPRAAVDEMARRGVKTLYLQTSRWKQPEDIVNPAMVDIFLERAHSKGISVVGWYVPGFGDLERDLRRSMAVIQYRSAGGERFDGFAPDIETKEELGGDRARFNAGIIEYTRLLREAAGPSAELGAIVLDAKNNERAPNSWAGFPWAEIGRNYNVILPMAYWTVTKKSACSTEMDTASYMRQVVEKTEALMGVQRPFHIIGGIADCTTAQEVSAYVQSLRQLGSIGGGLYDYATTQANPQRDQLWEDLAKLNS